VADFLLELLSEEIPARMQANARNELARKFAECTSEAGLKSGPIDVYSTPRRLALIAREVAEATEASREEVKGPRASAPPQALEGFLRKTGLTKDQLAERDGVYFALIERAWRPASEILSDTVRRIVADFPWPKSMRWGDGDLRWVRPLHGIVAMLGEDIVPVEIAGTASGATTVGHRFHHPGDITIGGASDYVEKLRACHVIVDQEERERIVRDGAAAAAKEAGLTLLADEGLVVENAGLTEWPVPLVGRFDPEFLDVPREVIVLTMRTNQKYFACTNDEGLLAPAFVCVANIAANDGGEAIAQGNARVLAARLADARFFWEQDLKIPLEEQAKKLDGIVFHEKLGTVADKVERVAKLARWLVESGVVAPSHCHSRESGNPAFGKGTGTPASAGVTKEELADQVERAARLAKADLVTGMVGEFPELQGVIGGYLAEAQGEAKAVADAIRDHYKPLGQGDGVPTTSVTVAVALADKLDSIAVFFGVDLKPTGSKDPFALRRAAIGSIEIIVANGLRIPLTQALRGSLANHAAQSKDSSPAHRLDRTVPEILAFFADRLKVQQREAGVRHDLIDAVFALGGEDDLVRLLARVKALQNFVETEDGTNLLVAYKRAANILKKEEWNPSDVKAGEAPPEEILLNDSLISAENAADEAIIKEDFSAAMAALASLRKPIDAFFDKVTVNVEDVGVRARRLNLLMRFRDAVNRVADFSRIEG
jgi:glycyl-tRNA synthetase beta chain